MVYNTDICIAYKDKLGLYKIQNITIFNLNNMWQVFPAESFKRQGKELSFTIRCPICDEKHNYTYCVSDFLKKEMIIGGCEVIGKPIFVFGNSIKVLSFIERYNEVNRKIYAML